MAIPFYLPAPGSTVSMRAEIRSVFHSTAHRNSFLFPVILTAGELDWLGSFVQGGMHLPSSPGSVWIAFYFLLFAFLVHLFVLWIR